ncbi:MAG: hypothetical protein AB7H48_08235 [Parachlamydiales bacterium]
MSSISNSSYASTSYQSMEDLSLATASINLGIDSYGMIDNLSELEAAFCQATKNFSEAEVIQYVRDGHLPPAKQAFKIRKKCNHNIATSLVVLASGTIFRTGKNKEINQGACSLPGGNESILLGQGCNKKVFSVKDLNTQKQVAIAVAIENYPDTLLEMQHEAEVTNQISSPYILRVDYYVRPIELKSGISDQFRKGYLESEVCLGGSLKEHQELATDPIVRAQLVLAVKATHAAGFAHHDIDAGNVVFVDIPNTEQSLTLRIKLIDFAQAQKLRDTNKEELIQRDANQLGRLCPW